MEMTDDVDAGSTEDFPSIGDRRAGRILVCMGDDRPDQLIDWLDALVSDFEELKTIADEHVVKVNAGSQGGVMNDWSDFCSALGVHIDSNFWEGSMISGHLQMGWIQPGQIRRAQKIGKEILKEIRRDVLEQIRSAAISEIKKIKDLDRLIERISDDRPFLLAQIGHLKAALAETQKTMTALEQAVAEAKVNDASALTMDCLRIAGAVLNRERVRLIAGPLVLWDDGVIYALTSRGKVPLPDDSSPALLLKVLQRSGHPTVDVSEMTVIGGWTSGPIYRKGSIRISGWINVWRDVEQNRERVFVVANPDKLAVVRNIHKYFKTKPRE
jgi:hypothetical protein